MQTTTRDYADAWLGFHEFPKTESNRTAFALLVRSVGNLNGDERESLAPSVLDALTRYEFTSTDDDGAEHNVHALGDLRRAFTTGTNPFEHNRALLSLGVPTGVDAIDGDFPAWDENAGKDKPEDEPERSLWLDAELDVDDDEAARIGLADADGGMPHTTGSVAVPAGGLPHGTEPATPADDDAIRDALRKAGAPDDAIAEMLAERDAGTIQLVILEDGRAGVIVPVDVLAETAREANGDGDDDDVNKRVAEADERDVDTSSLPSPEADPLTHDPLAPSGSGDPAASTDGA